MLNIKDPEVYELIKKEEQRQQDKLSMIPSENFFSPAVREAVGSVFMHKYAEGNVGKRYYEGNEFVDELEKLAQNRARKAFKLPDDWGVNIQALAGSNANLAVYLAILEFGDTVLSLYLPDGGHLSHGWSYDPTKSPDPRDPQYFGGPNKVNITSKMFNIVQYKTDPDTNLLDYDSIEKIALEHRPKLIITGGTAYPRDIDYRRMREIADKVGAMYHADIAHEAGLVAGEAVPSPVGIADVVTLTTHKTLRSGRGSLILAPKSLIKKINRGVLPGLQGGPFNNNIAGIAVGLKEATTPEFKAYTKQVVKNAQIFANALIEYGFDVVSGGTDKHLVLVDMRNKNIYGKKTSRALAHAGIIMNMNTIPGETRSPADPSGIRLGTPWVTTRGMKESEMKQIAKWINEVVEEVVQWTDLEFEEFEEMVMNSQTIKRIEGEVKALCDQFPLDI